MDPFTRLSLTPDPRRPAPPTLGPLSPAPRASAKVASLIAGRVNVPAIPDEPRDAHRAGAPRSLRLITPEGSVTLDHAEAARDIARENEQAIRAARTLAPEDARRILLRRAAREIEGGRAAIIRPEVRRRLLQTAERLGVRPFDANLVIAVVQDRARRGEDPAGAEAHATAVTTTLPHPRLEREQQLQHAWMLARRIVAAGTIAVLILALLTRWLTQG